MLKFHYCISLRFVGLGKYNMDLDHPWLQVAGCRLQVAGCRLQVAGVDRVRMNGKKRLSYLYYLFDMWITFL